MPMPGQISKQTHTLVRADEAFSGQINLDHLVRQTKIFASSRVRNLKKYPPPINCKWLNIRDPHSDRLMGFTHLREGRFF